MPTDHYHVKLPTISCYCYYYYYYYCNHNYSKILKSDWLSTALISALIGQFNRTVRVMLAKQNFEFLVF